MITIAQFIKCQVDVCKTYWLTILLMKEKNFAPVEENSFLLKMNPFREEICLFLMDLCFLIDPVLGFAEDCN